MGLDSGICVRLNRRKNVAKLTPSRCPSPSDLLRGQLTGLEKAKCLSRGAVDGSANRGGTPDGTVEVTALIRFNRVTHALLGHRFLPGPDAEKVPGGVRYVREVLGPPVLASMVDDSTRIDAGKEN
jgi:hypothetical protein